MPIGIDLGPPPELKTHISRSFDALNGISLAGKTLSIDLLFTNNEFARLFTMTSPSFTCLIALRTNDSGIVGFLEGTGLLLANTARIQECHVTIGHILCELVETELVHNGKDV